MAPIFSGAAGTMRLVHAALSVVICALLGCSSKSASSANDPSDSTPLGDDGIVSCAGDPLAATYAAGMQQVGSAGIFRATIVHADPAPPAIGTNTWVIAIADAKGAAVVDATFPPASDWGA